ncbi:2OG-Fe(II) oxygenase [Mycena latifolia]|nr:2OG-Fe(II) oxygenase [Mycena latifolia]
MADMNAPTPLLVIDLGAPQESTVHEIKHACQTTGLFYVKNHGIPQPILDLILSVSAEFFTLSDAEKLELYQPDPVSSNMGYRGVCDSNIDHDNEGDMVEGLSVQSQAHDDTHPLNKWPAQVPALRSATMEYYAVALELGTRLHRLTSIAMGAGDGFFDDKTKYNLSRIRLLRYPEQTKEVMGAGQHSDFGTMTILLQQPGIAALQFLDVDADRGWTDVPPIAGTLLVNLGDQTAICTNGVFKSPLHRVISRPGAHRHSVALFFLADFDVILQPDERFVSAERPPRYEPMTAAAQLEKRVAESRA